MTTPIAVLADCITAQSDYNCVPFAFYTAFVAAVASCVLELYAVLVVVVVIHFYTRKSFHYKPHYAAIQLVVTVKVK